MKIKPEFIAMDIDDTPYLVPVGGIAFHGIIRGNETAGFILSQLNEETSEGAIADALCAEYGAPRDLALSDVKKIIGKLREIGAIED